MASVGLACRGAAVNGVVTASIWDRTGVSEGLASVSPTWGGPDRPRSRRSRLDRPSSGPRPRSEPRSGGRPLVCSGPPRPGIRSRSCSRRPVSGRSCSARWPGWDPWPRRPSGKPSRRGSRRSSRRVSRRSSLRSPRRSPAGCAPVDLGPGAPRSAGRLGSARGPWSRRVSWGRGAACWEARPVSPGARPAARRAPAHPSAHRGSGCPGAGRSSRSWGARPAAWPGPGCGRARSGSPGSRCARWAAAGPGRPGGCSMSRMPRRFSLSRKVATLTGRWATMRWCCPSSPPPR
jgi:hypothetical protein